MPEARSPFLDASGWTFDTLNTHITGWVSSELSRHETMFTERDKAISAALVSQEKAIRAALDSAERAVNKSELASEKRFESVNEFRKALDDAQRTFMTRLEAMALIQRAADDIAELKERAWAAQGAQAGVETARTKSQQTTNLIIGVVGVLIAVLVVVLNLVT